MHQAMAQGPAQLKTALRVPALMAMQAAQHLCPRALSGHPTISTQLRQALQVGQVTVNQMAVHSVDLFTPGNKCCKSVSIELAARVSVCSCTQAGLLTCHGLSSHSRARPLPACAIQPRPWRSVACLSV